MAESNLDKSAENASSPDELVQDLDVKLTEGEEDSVVGGRKAGKLQHEYLIVKMNDVIITGVTQ